MSEEAVRKSHATTWWLCLAALPLLYALSCGPLRFLSIKYELRLWAYSAVDVFYGPLCWVEEQPWGKPLDTYEKWWCVQAGGS